MQQRATLLGQSQILRDILSRQQVTDAEGAAHPLHSEVSVDHAEALYRTVRAEKPHVVIEVGMAYGVSSLSILTALEELGQGRLISIDPFQNTDWKGIGRLNVERAGLGERHTLIDELDYLALPRLVSEGVRAQLGYIDGWHTFDYAMLDFWYLDKMLDAKSLVGFNDAGYRGVHRAIRFALSHRRYKEANVRLARRWEGRNILVSAARRLRRIPTQDRYLRKLQQWEPAWNFYAPF